MSDPQTPNKQFNIPIRGSDVGVWDTSLNANFRSMDSLLGAGYSIGLSSTNVTLTESDANNLYFNLTGALLADVEVIFPAIGGIFVINNQTTGAHTVTILTSAAGSTGIEVAQGDTIIVYLDGTNAYPAAPAANAFTSGTKMLFAQAAAPTGWTQITTNDDIALRVVSGTGGGVHGTVGLSTFLSDGALGHTLVIGEIPSHSHGVTDPGHSHSYQKDTFFDQGGGQGNADGQPEPTQTGSATTGITINDTGGGGSHAHALADLQYLDLIQASKN